MLFCDACDKGYHMNCQQPPVFNKPTGMPRHKYIILYYVISVIVKMDNGHYNKDSCVRWFLGNTTINLCGRLLLVYSQC